MACWSYPSPNKTYLRCSFRFVLTDTTEMISNLIRYLCLIGFLHVFPLTNVLRSSVERDYFSDLHILVWHRTMKSLLKTSSLSSLNTDAFMFKMTLLKKSYPTVFAFFWTVFAQWMSMILIVMKFDWMSYLKDIERTSGMFDRGDFSWKKSDEKIW